MLVDVAGEQRVNLRQLGVVVERRCSRPSQRFPAARSTVPIQHVIYYWYMIRFKACLIPEYSIFGDCWERSDFDGTPAHDQNTELSNACSLLFKPCKANLLLALPLHMRVWHVQDAAATMCKYR